METAPAPMQEGIVLQTMAHELRQPLSALESIAYYLGMVLPHREARAREQVVRIRQLIEQSNWILSCGLRLTVDDPPSPEAMDLDEVITQAVAARSSSGEPHTMLNLAGNLPLVQFDPEQARALMANLLMLVAQNATPQHPPRVRTWTDGAVFVEFATSAPGHGSEASLGAGAALGVESARRIVEAHAGAFALYADPASGIRVQVVLP